MALILVLQNITALAPVSDYKYCVLVGDGTIAHSKTLASGTILAHTRADGWPALVQRLLAQTGKDHTL